MRLGLITTTINIPKVLGLYRAYSPNDDGRGVRFFVAGDRKTPMEAINYIESLDGCSYVFNQGWKCSELLGWDTITRRNIALLEALKWGADVIITIDDDNFPLSPTYFYDFAHLFAPEFCFNGLQVTGEWFDAGQWQYPESGNPVVQRGFPQQKKSDGVVGIATGAKIGMAQGIILGDPDTSAVDRISSHPSVHHISELFQSGFVVPPGTWTVCNTQNTAVLRQFAPALLCCPQFGRYDDIFASLICQRIMREKGYVTHFGKPFVYQQRNEHDLVKDLRAELFGMANIENLANALDNIAGFDCDVRTIYEQLSKQPWFPKEANTLAQTWMDDVESVL